MFSDGVAAVATPVVAKPSLEVAHDDVDVVITSAVYSEADYIITRNAKHFPTDHIPVLSPKEFLVVRR